MGVEVRTRPHRPWVTVWTPKMVWLSQACPAGGKLEELLGGSHHDAGSDRWHREGEKWDSGPILKIKPKGLADGLDMEYERRRVVRMCAGFLSMGAWRWVLTSWAREVTRGW